MRGYCQAAIDRELTKDEANGLGELLSDKPDWRAEPGSVDAAYYAYVRNALTAMDGSRLALQGYEQYWEECRELTRFRRNRDRSYEWLGEGPGISRLVHQSRLGDWDRELGFWKNRTPHSYPCARLTNQRTASRFHRTGRRLEGLLRPSQLPSFRKAVRTRPYWRSWASAMMDSARRTFCATRAIDLKANCHVASDRLLVLQREGQVEKVGSSERRGDRSR